MTDKKTDWLTEVDVILIKKQCEHQHADTPSELIRFALAYAEAKILSRLGVPPTEDLVNRWAKLIVPYWNDKYRLVPITLHNQVGGLKPELIPGAMEKYYALIENMTAEEAYFEFERIHPYYDGNGRVGHLIWALKMTKEKREWPTHLPPKMPEEG